MLMDGIDAGPRGQRAGHPMTTTMARPIYTVSRIMTGYGYRASYPRWLYRDGERVGIVDSNLGPAVLGQMTEAEAREQFPDLFRRLAEDEDEDY